jgi:hypothetical protein
VSEPQDSLKDEVSGSLRAVRERARSDPAPSAKPTPYPASEQQTPLASIQEAEAPAMPVSPNRERLNELWDLSKVLQAPTGIVRGLVRRLLRFAWGPLVDRQLELNSAQVRFDNELVEYIDQRLDRISAHYDQLLGLYGKRMEEIDERHLILQQELIRHVHELVKRIDFVFETAEQNHLYLEGMLREAQEELRDIARRVEELSASPKR